MLSRVAITLVFALAFAFVYTSAACRSSSPTADSTGLDNGLRSASSFAEIKNNDQRAAALFREAARVLTHPRCANCHPADKRPRQGDASLMHVPPVWGGEDGRGVPALRCTSCHQSANYAELTMPGAPGWHLAPPEMVFLQRSPAQICETIKRNAASGGMSIEKVVDHVGHDALVAWGFAPGPARGAAPGSQQTLHGLFRAWADAGAACPTEGSP